MNLFPGLLLLAGVLVVMLIWTYRDQLEPSYLFTIGVVLQLFSGQSDLLGLPIGLDRLFMALALLLCLRRLRREGISALHLGLKHVLLLLCAVFLIVSAVVAKTAFSPFGFFALLDRVGLVPFIAFTLAPVLYRTDRQRNVLLAALVGCGVYLSLTAILEMLGPSSLILPPYIADPSVGIHFGRARGPFLESAINGLVMIMCACAAYAGFLTWTKRWQRHVAAAVIPLCAIGAFLTVTRAVWLAALVGAVIVGLSDSSLRRYVVRGAVAVLVVVAGAFAFIPEVREVSTARANEQLPVYDRLNTNEAAIAAGNDNPLFGVGFNKFPELTDEYLWQRDDVPLTGSGLIVHNVFLARYAELGVLGSAIWLAAYLSCIGAACLARVRTADVPWLRALRIVVVAWCVVSMFGPTSAAMPNLLLWLWAGIVAAMARQNVDPSTAVSRPGERADALADRSA